MMANIMISIMDIMIRYSAEICCSVFVSWMQSNNNFNIMQAFGFRRGLEAVHKSTVNDLESQKTPTISTWTTVTLSHERLSVFSTFTFLARAWNTLWSGDALKRNHAGSVWNKGFLNWNFFVGGKPQSELENYAKCLPANIGPWNKKDESYSFMF